MAHNGSSNTHCVEVCDGEFAYKAVRVLFSKEEYNKLARLAKRRKLSIQQVLRRFAMTCQLEVSSWKPPTDRGEKKCLI